MAILPLGTLGLLQTRIAPEDWPPADKDTLINVFGLLFSAGAINLVPAINWAVQYNILARFEPPDITFGSVVVTCAAGVLAVITLYRGLKPPTPYITSEPAAINPALTAAAILITVIALLRNLKDSAPGRS